MKSVIIDADFASDVGDLGGVALACAAHRMGMVNIIGAIYCASATKGPGSMSACLNYWGVTPSIGTWKGASGQTIDEDGWSGQTWMTYLYDNYTRQVGLASTVTDSTVQYRALLATSTTKVDIITTGYMQCLSALLDSPADSISSLSGAQLVTAKVRHLWVMGGQYTSGTEFNLCGGANLGGNYTANSAYFCAASNNVAANWPTPITWCGYELGTFACGGTSLWSSGTLMYDAYSQAGYPSGRTAWDEICVLCAIQEGSDFTFTTGTNAVNASTGANTFTASATGTQRYATKATSDQYLLARINKMMAQTPGAFTGWSGAPALAKIQMN